MNRIKHGLCLALVALLPLALSACSLNTSSKGQLIECSGTSGDCAPAEDTTPDPGNCVDVDEDGDGDDHDSDSEDADSDGLDGADDPDDDSDGVADEVDSDDDSDGVNDDVDCDEADGGDDDSDAP
jgi:hypothetical protein